MLGVITTITCHHQTIQAKTFLKKVYTHFHQVKIGTTAR